MENRRPSALLVLFLYVAAVLLLSGILLPVLWKAGHAFGTMVHSFKLQETPVIGWVAEKCLESPVPRYFNRAGLIAALVLLWPLQKVLRLGRADFGMEPNPVRILDLVIGFVFGASLLAVLDLVLLQNKLLLVNKKAVWESAAGAAIGSAFVVAVLEEFLFRGAFYGAVRRTLSAWPALLGVAALFAVIHFLKLRGPDEKAVEAAVQAAGGVGWGTGFMILKQMLGNLADPMLLAEEFATLFGLGILLGWARLRTGSLWLAIGLHAGIVFMAKTFGEMTRASKALKADKHLPWVGHDPKTGVVTGLAPLGALIVIALLVWVYLRMRQKHRAQHGLSS